MSPNRREFIKNVGIAMVSLVMTRCMGQDGGGTTGAPKPSTPTPTPEPAPTTCYSPLPTPQTTCYVPTPTLTSPDLPADARGRLRDCWGRLDWLADQVLELERGEAAKDQLIAEHRAALDQLVAAGELTEAVADQVQSAFAAGAYHVWRSYAPITCYQAMLVDYTPTSARQLVRQAELLTEMAQAHALDPAVVDQVQAAIERDVAFLALSQPAAQAMYNRLIEATDGRGPFPSFDELELQVTPEAEQAAQFLVELLLQEGE